MSLNNHKKLLLLLNSFYFKLFKLNFLKIIDILFKKNRNKKN